MENKQTTVRETHYEYGENEKLTSMTINETITNPCGGCVCDKGELVTDEVEVAELGPTFTEVALALIGLGVSLSAIASIFKHR